jgi:hypothetical protein
MKALTIKDLPVAAELDAATLAAVRGGCAPSYCMPASYCTPSWGGPQFDFNKSSTNFNAAQQLDQSQNTLVNNGNNVAFASGISSTVTPHQTGSNNINFA